MDLQIAGRCGLVTGASAGIGRGIALALGREGVRLAIAGRRRDKLDEVAALIADAGGPAPTVIVQDFMDEDAAARIAAQALDALGRVEILINNAGGSRPFGAGADEAQWHEAMTLNFTRHRQLTDRLLPGMRAGRWGRIVNITGKSEPDNVNGAFCAKAAVHSWAKGLSREVGKDGITVNCIPPGRILSDQILRNYTPSTASGRPSTRSPPGSTASPRTSPTWSATWSPRWRATSPVR